jgi:formate hydrogenlyase subunit 3/multisubunit Na+/H+ antiporter MnhD subunit
MESGAPEAAGGLFACLIMAVVGIIGLACFAVWLWMLIDAIKYTPSENNLKLIWILVILLTGIIGALIYMFVQRPKNQEMVAEGPPAEGPPPGA